MSVREKVAAFIKDNFLFGGDFVLHDDTSFLEEGIIDSTGIMQLVAFIEEEYAVWVKDEELIPENLDSVNRVAAFIEAKTRAMAAVQGAPPQTPS